MRQVNTNFGLGNCLLGLGLFLTLFGCPAPEKTNPETVHWTPEERELLYTLSPLPSPPSDPSNRYADDPNAAHLGQYLFYEKRLSAGGKLSCQNCHQPSKGFSDGLAVSSGLGKTTRNAPTLWNVAYQRWFFWDGRSDSLWAQAIQPLESDLEMGGSRLEIIHLLRQDTELKQAYQKTFGPLPDFSDLKRFPKSAKPLPEQPQDPRHLAWQGMRSEDQFQVNQVMANLLKAIAAYERRILTQTAPFDQFIANLRQDPVTATQISPLAQKGLKLFIGRGQCILCHTGPTFSDKEFHNLGLPALPQGLQDRGRYQGISLLKRDIFNRLGHFSDLIPESTENDQLLYLEQQVTNLGEFKTPTLRQIAQSAPYMHDGRFGTLEEVLAFYSNPLQGKPAQGRQEDTLQPLELKADELVQLKAFLESLSGKTLPAELLKQPPSPLLPTS